MKAWTSEFHPESHTIINVAVWIIIYGLPIEYYDAKVLHAIGDRVGRTIKVDKNTIQRERGKYTRLCVEVNISKPLLAMFTIRENSYKIEYEGLHMLCLLCGKFGHYKDGCQLKRKDKKVSQHTDNRVIVRSRIVVNEDMNSNGNGNGPWQVVHKQQRGRKQMEGVKKHSIGN